MSHRRSNCLLCSLTLKTISNNQNDTSKGICNGRTGYNLMTVGTSDNASRADKIPRLIYEPTGAGKLPSIYAGIHLSHNCLSNDSKNLLRNDFLILLSYKYMVYL